MNLLILIMYINNKLVYCLLILKIDEFLYMNLSVIINIKELLNE